MTAIGKIISAEFGTVKGYYFLFGLQLGFKFDDFIKPNYTYYNSNVDRFKRFHKFNFRKAKLLKKYPNLDPRMTETEMAKELGYDRIWDCGLIKYVYTNPDYIEN